MQVRRAALAFAREVERRWPDLVTTAWWKEQHGAKVFVDDEVAYDLTPLLEWAERCPILGPRRPV